MNEPLPRTEWPISSFDIEICRWKFIEIFHGTYDDASIRATFLQSQDVKRQYRIWDCR